MPRALEDIDSDDCNTESRSIEGNGLGGSLASPPPAALHASPTVSCLGGSRGSSRSASRSVDIPSPHSATAARPPGRLVARPLGRQGTRALGRQRPRHSMRWRALGTAMCALLCADARPVGRPYLRAVAQHVDLVLGSASASRQSILCEAGFSFAVRKADLNELAIGDRKGSPEALVAFLARAKASAIKSGGVLCSSTMPTILLTADQVVTCHGRILEKPKSADEAREFLSLYSSGSCSTVGSLLLTDLRNGKEAAGVQSSTVHFSEIPRHVIEEVVAEGRLLHCAGGLMVEHPLLCPFIRRIDGGVDSVMGLSTSLLEELFRELAIEVGY